MSDLEASLDALAAETQFPGAVRVDRGDTVELAKAYGFAHRALEVPNTVDTQFALASGNKGFTALAVVSLIEDGTLELSTTARSVLGTDLPLIADDVTVEHLLANRSGIGDYLDEDLGYDIDDYMMKVPVQDLVTIEAFLPLLDCFPTKFPAGEQFSYCNAGFVVLALMAERVSGVEYHELVEQRVCAPAAMHDTEWLRSDELPGRAALGYLTVDGPRTNVFHLPVRGTGDGGMYSTVADIFVWRQYRTLTSAEFNVIDYSVPDVAPSRGRHGRDDLPDRPDALRAELRGRREAVRSGRESGEGHHERHRRRHRDQQR